jgi:DNA polymerase-3 subunit epsilon
MITPATAETGYAPEEAIEKFAIWLQDAVLVGHHIAFDSAILSHTLHRHKGCSLQNKSIDTALLAIRLLEPPHNREHLQPSDYSLSKLAGKLKIPVFEQHTAAGDALTTALVFLKLFTMAKARGIHTLGDLCK